MSRLKPELKRGEQTRLRILTEAASLFHHNGYTSTGLDELLERTGVTKGAFYHHFRSKKEVALAVIEEIVADQLRRRMIDPIINAPEPLVAIRKAISRLRKEVPTEELLTGCPVNNLASELALQDKDFQSALGTLFNEWERAWTEALRRELESGRAHNYKDPREFSLYLIALIEGAQALAKAQQTRKPLDAALKRLDSILATA